MSLLYHIACKISFESSGRIDGLETSRCHPIGKINVEICILTINYEVHIVNELNIESMGKQLFVQNGKCRYSLITLQRYIYGINAFCSLGILQALYE